MILQKILSEYESVMLRFFFAFISLRICISVADERDSDQAQASPLYFFSLPVRAYFSETWRSFINVWKRLKENVSVKIIVFQVILLQYWSKKKEKQKSYFLTVITIEYNEVVSQATRVELKSGIYPLFYFGNKIIGVVNWHLDM